jgi:hypothetical protein
MSSESHSHLALFRDLEHNVESNRSSKYMNEKKKTTMIRTYNAVGDPTSLKKSPLTRHDLIAWRTQRLHIIIRLHILCHAGTAGSQHPLYDVRNCR